MPKMLTKTQKHSKHSARTRFSIPIKSAEVHVLLLKVTDYILIQVLLEKNCLSVALIQRMAVKTVHAHVWNSK